MAWMTPSDSDATGARKPLNVLIASADSVNGARQSYTRDPFAVMPATSRCLAKRAIAFPETGMHPSPGSGVLDIESCVVGARP